MGAAMETVSKAKSHGGVQGVYRHESMQTGTPMTFAVFVVYGFMAHAFRRAVVESPRVQNWLRRGFAASFAGLGVNLALSNR